MTENDVKVIARETVDAYDEKIGAPRHRENRKDIKALQRICFIGLGAVLLLQVLISAGWIHVRVQ